KTKLLELSATPGKVAKTTNARMPTNRLQANQASGWSIRGRGAAVAISEVKLFRRVVKTLPEPSLLTRPLSKSTKYATAPSVRDASSVAAAVKRRNSIYCGDPPLHNRFTAAATATGSWQMVKRGLAAVGPQRWTRRR